MKPIQPKELEQYIQESDKNRNYSQSTPDERLKGDKEREFFISKFPRSEIRNIKMLDYVPGKTVNGDTDREAFAYLTEFGSRNFGAIGGGSAKKFAIYMGKKSQEPVYPQTFASADAAYDSTINLIADCVDHAEDFIRTKDWKKFSDVITQSVESQSGTPSIPVISKIIAMYYPDEFLRIWSHQWLNKILDLFQVDRDDLPETGKEGRFYEKMQRVIEAKNSHPIMKEWSNKYFSYIIGDYIVEKNPAKSKSPLLKFLKSEMKMGANYQPIVIKMLLEAEDGGFTVSIKQIRKKFDELNFGRMSYVKASGRPGGNDAISSVAGALKKLVKFPEGTSQGNATLKEDVVTKEEIPECLKICGQRIAGWHIDNIIDDDFEVYGVKPGTEEDDFVYLDDFMKLDHIGSGWNQLGDLSKYSTKAAGLEYIRNNHPKYVKTQQATQVRFDVKPKDIVVLTKGQKEIIDFGIVIGDYHFRTDVSGKKIAAHTRSVVWLKRGNIKKENFPDERILDGKVGTVNLIDKYKKEMIDLLLEEEKAEIGNYFVITSQEKSKYKDKEGEQYQFPLHIPDAKKFVKGTNFVVQTKIKGQYYFMGYGKVGAIEKEQETNEKGKQVTMGTATYSKYTKFNPEKLRTEKIGNKFDNIAFPRGKPNIRPAMLKIPRKLYEEITGDRSTMATDQTQDTSELARLYKILERKKQIILYGPPGTGKTFSANQLRDYILADQNPKQVIKISGTQHDPDVKSTSEQQINTMATIIRKHKKIGRGKLADLFSTQSGTGVSTFNKLKHLVVEIYDDIAYDKGRKEYSSNLNSSDEPEDEKKLSEPDKPKEIVVVTEFSKNITFHQSYSYEDFVEGIRPIITNDNKVIYKPVDGVFKKISSDAREDPSNKYVLVIDEINRGNIEKIFGELITLIEDDKRVKSQKTTLPYTQQPFWVPRNLLIIGTMNTADRSIAQLDTALRRRFAFEELMPKSELVNTEIDGISLQTLLEELNNRIRAEGISLRDKQIGHSYFMKVKSLSDLRITFAVELVPLLQDYFYSDYKKLEENILNSDFIDSEKMMIKEEWQKDDGIFKTAINKILGQ